MNGHWSEEEISRWISGGRAEGAGAHLRECAECAAKVALAESAFGEFRGAMQSWSASQGPVRFMASAASPRRVPVLRWAAAVAALIALSAIPAYRHRQDEVRRAEMARADAILLEQVDAEVSEAVPEPMLPLVKLVSWGSTKDDKGDVR